MYFIVILSAVQYKVGIEKEWQKFGQNPLDLIQQAKGGQSKLESHLRYFGFLTMRR